MVDVGEATFVQSRECTNFFLNLFKILVQKIINNSQHVSRDWMFDNNLD